MVDKIWYNMEELIGGSEERGINRNILECKGITSYTMPKGAIGINRNILECKVICRLRSPTSVWVLIETYWNVKKPLDGVERHTCPVLIETYWNVKENLSK